MAASSSLALQLQKLREDGAGSKQKTDSFLYDSREAARIDNETVYNLAWNGLLELQQIDAELASRLQIVQPVLFNRSRINFHRAHNNKAEELELNDALKTVLEALSAHFLSGAAHKVLEFLVRRYEIHRYNVDDTMALIISYHESTWFARMVRLLHIHDTRWEFLLQVKQHGQPLNRAALVQRALDESSIIEFIFQAAKRIGAANAKLISLYTLITLQMLERAKVSEQTLRWVIPHQLTALKTTDFPEMQSSAYMIITKLVSKAILADKVLVTLMRHLLKYAQPGMHMNALLCMIFMAQSQTSFFMNRSVAKHLVEMDNIVDLLADASLNYDTSKFVHVLSFFLMQHMAKTDDEYHQLLAAMVDRLTAVHEIYDEIVRQLLQLAKNHKFDLENDHVQAASSLLIVCSKKRATDVDAILSAVMGERKSTNKGARRMNQFIGETFGKVANSAHFVPAVTGKRGVKTSLAVALDSSADMTRVQAIRTLSKNHLAAREAGLENVITTGDVLLRRLQDDNAYVVKTLVSSSLTGLMLELCSKKKCFETVAQVVHRWSLTNRTDVVEELMNFVTKDFRGVVTGDKLLLLILTLVPDVGIVSKKKRPAARIDAIWNWLASVDHPLCADMVPVEVPADESTDKEEDEKDEEEKTTKKESAKKIIPDTKTVKDIVEVFGAALAKNVQTLLPGCLRWSEASEINVTPLTSLLIHVLEAARKVVTKKSPNEQRAAFEQSFRFILKKEFSSVCETASITEKHVGWAANVANLLCEAAKDVFKGSREDFDSCVSTLLQSPTQIFLHVHGSLHQLFQGALEQELLPTLARLVTSPKEDALLTLSKCRALDIISAVLEGLEDSTDEAELKQVAHVVPAVLVALADSLQSVRQSAVACLERWAQSSDDQARASTDLKTLQHACAHFVKAKQDILLDSQAIKVLFSTYAMSSTKKESTAFYQLLLTFIASGSKNEIVTAVQLLKLLAHVQEASFWLLSVDYFQQTLAGLLQSKKSNLETESMKQLLGNLIEHYFKAEATGKQQHAPKPFSDALLSILEAKKSSVSEFHELQATTLSQLSPAFYTSLNDVTQHVLVGRLIDLLMSADQVVVTAAVQCFHRLPLTYAIVIRLLEEELASHKKKSTDFQRLSCILEIVAVKADASDESTISANQLLKTLGDVLVLFCEPSNTNSVSEYLLQILFGCLRRVCEVTGSISGGKSPAAVVSVPGKSLKNGVKSVTAEPELLVKNTLTCLGRTASPTTRNEALLFVSSLVNLYPASVLKSLDKILSFLGTGSIQQEDDYSFHVLDTIVKSVVPHILEGKESGLITAQQFIGLFVQAYGQIPASRRELLFGVLLNALGHELLPYCAVSLIERGVNNADDLDELTAFAHSLCFTFDGSFQVSTLVTILRIARDLFPEVQDDADTDTDDVDDDDEEDDAEEVYEPFVFDPETLKSKPLARRLNTALVIFVRSHLQARELHHKILQEQQIASVDDDEDEEMDSDALQRKYLELAQVVLLYFRRVAREQSLHEDDAAGFWTNLSNETIEILGALQQLLSTPGFVAVISELVHHDNSLVRKKAMQLFNERLQQDRASLTSGEELLFVDMLDELDVILQNTDGNENTVNIQTALLSVDILARNFASEHSKRFQKGLATIVKYVDIDVSTASPTSLHLLGCAMVCLSSICRAVGPVVFPFLPKFFPRLLTGIEFCASKKSKSKKNEDADEIAGLGGMKTVLQCLLSSLEVFTAKIPQFLAPYLSKILQVLLLPSLLSTNTSNQQVLLSIDGSLMNLCNLVELRHLLPNVVGAYDFVLDQGDISTEKLFSVVSTIVSSLTPASLRLYLAQLARFYVMALDMRRVHAQQLKDLDAVEDDMLDGLVQFILKLSEKQLKPLFLKICEWSQAKLPASHAAATGAMARRVVFFKLLIKLSDNLRGIFVPYYAHVLENLTQALVESREVLSHKSKTSAQDNEDTESDDDDFFTREDEPATKKKKLVNGKATQTAAAADSVPRETHFLVLRTAVAALNGCFVHDSEGFMEKERFDLIMSPLVDVADILKAETSLEAKTFVFDEVVSCLANLAWAAKSDLLWKPLHYAVLMKSRSDVASVRLATLKTIEKCYQVIGDEFLAMLPESIPFLAELMEDNDAEVERTCHQVIKQIEEISGESLDQYLTS